jgi:peptidyl-prolyl cis-trans isomerase D
MIEAMRGRLAKWVIRILAVFLILSFAVWGIGDVFRGRAPNETVASVGDSLIEFEHVSTQLGRLLNIMRQRVGPDFDLQQAAQLGMVDQTVDQIINGRLLELEANRLKMVVSEDLIRQTIFADPRFQGPGNRFDRTTYQQILQSEGMSEGAFVQLMRDNILRQQISSAFTASSRVPSTLLDTLYRYRNEKRTANVLTIAAGNVTEIPRPAPAVLAEYHRDNPARFTKPEYRSITMIYLDPDKAAKEIRPDEKRILEEYEYRKETQGIPERRTLEQVLLQDEEKAKKVAAATLQGRSLADAAKDNGASVSDLGLLARRDLPAPIADKAFALPTNGVTAPIKSTLGWHVIRVTRIDAGRVPKLEDLRPGIVENLARDIAIDSFVKLTAKLDDTLASGRSLEDAASGIGISPIRVAALDAVGNGPDGKPLKSIPRSAEFTEMVFRTAKGEASNVEEAKNGGYYIFRVDDIIPPLLQPLDAVRVTAIAAWKESQVQDVARKKAKALLEAAKTAGSLENAAKTAKLTMTTSKPFTRFIREPGSPVSPELSTELFKAKPGAIVMASNGGGYAVGELKAVIPANVAKNQAESDALRKQLEASLANDKIDQYLGALRKRYAVKVFPAAVERLITGRSGPGY